MAVDLNCDKCGTLLIDSEGKHYVPEIYFEYEPDAVFCGNCNTYNMRKQT